MLRSDAVHFVALSNTIRGSGSYINDALLDNICCVGFLRGGYTRPGQCRVGCVGWHLNESNICSGWDSSPMWDNPTIPTNT